MSFILLHSKNFAKLHIIFQEIQRVANILPSNLVHRVTKDVVIDGYHLPEGTAIVPQISALFIDDEVFHQNVRNSIISVGSFRFLKIQTNFNPNAFLMKMED